MLGEEALARDEFQKSLEHPEVAERARKCMAILELDAQSPDAKSVAMLKARLLEMPEDLVALDRLGAVYARSVSGDANAPADPLVFKALGMRAYRHGDYTRAVDWLTQSSQARPTDGSLLFYLGLAQEQLGHRRESAECLRKALTFSLKAAQVEEVNRLLQTEAHNR